MSVISELHFVPRMEHSRRTFQIVSGSLVGTCFVLDHNGVEYVITALHNVSEALETHMVSLRIGEGLKILVCDVVSTDQAFDIAVLRVHERLVPSGSDIQTAVGMSLGQEVFYIGYPLNIVPDVFDGFTVPFVNRGIVANVIKDPVPLIYLATTVSPGFSGAPIFAPDFTAGGQVKLIGMVLESLTIKSDVYNDREDIIGFVRADTGIGRAANIKRVIELLPA